jgi:hypothetical protein
VIFFWRGGQEENRAFAGVFKGGLREFVVQMDGKSLVICGGLRGKTWCLSTMFLGAENFPFF